MIKDLIKNTKKNLARNKINSPKDIVKTNFLMVDFSDSIKNSENEIRFFLKKKMYNKSYLIKSLTYNVASWCTETTLMNTWTGPAQSLYLAI